MSLPHRYFIVNKPYNMVSQFVSSHNVVLLKDLDFEFPEGTHAIGRLDNLSEGLLILTTNKKVTQLLFQGAAPHKRTYLVKVRHAVTESTVATLKAGITISAKSGGSYTTAPCDVRIVQPPANLFPHPFHTKDYEAYTWLQMDLTEGKFRQVRKMVGEVRHKCQRLIRMAIENLALDNLQPGEVKEIAEKDFFEQLNIHDWQS